MFRLLFNSFINPGILIHSTQLPKKMIRYLILFITIIVAIPSAWGTITNVSKMQEDLSAISAHLPTFETRDGILSGSDQSTSSLALQTTTTYFLYDIENKVPATTISQVADQNNLSFILTKTDLSIYAMGMQVQRYPFADVAFSTNRFRELLLSLRNNMHFVALFSLLFILVSTLFSVLLDNFFFSVVTHFIFLSRNKIVRPDHLWRVSLFSSFLPYTLLSLMKLWGMTLPFATIFLLTYVVTRQWLVLKTLPPNL